MPSPRPALAALLALSGPALWGTALSGTALWGTLLCACEPAPAGGATAATASAATDATPSAAPSTRAATEVASAAAAVASSAASASPLSQLLAAPPKAKMKRAKAYVLEHKARIGVYFGLPDGWRYDDPSWLSITPRDVDSGGWFVALRLRQPGLGEANAARLLQRGPQATRLGKDTKWDDWQDGVVGRERWPARIRRGRGEAAIGGHGQLEAIAAMVEVPETPAVGFVASWPASMPELETTMLDIARHLHRCKIEVGRGCVSEQVSEP